MKVNPNIEQYLKAENDKTNASTKELSNSKVVAKDSVKQADKVTLVRGEDRLELSANVRDVAAIAEQLKDASEVRADLVAELKAKVQSGTYNVNGVDIATTIVNKALGGLF